MGTDYICTYEKNDSIGSDAVVILKGIGNYTGSVKKTFKICANIADAEITVPDELWFKDYVNAGETDIAIGDKNITFDDQISVVLNGTTLQKDTDYTLVYADNSWVGNAVVTIKGMGGFAGSVEKRIFRRQASRWQSEISSIPEIRWRQSRASATTEQS